MPIFTYKCPQCGHDDDRLVSVSDRKPQYCNDCESGILMDEQFPDSFNFSLKGGGWFKTDKQY